MWNEITGRRQANGVSVLGEGISVRKDENVALRREESRVANSSSLHLDSVKHEHVTRVKQNRRRSKFPKPKTLPCANQSGDIVYNNAGPSKALGPVPFILVVYIIISKLSNSPTPLGPNR